jgi:predicted phosphodiesterase
MKKVTILLLFLFGAVGLRGQDFKFAVMSDSRGEFHGVNEPILSRLTNHLLKNNPDLKFILFLGDLIDGSWDNPQENFEQMKYWKKVMEPAYKSKTLAGKKVYVVPGNHEVRTPYDEKHFLEVFPDMPQNGPEDEKGLTYSFDYDSVHFVALDVDRWYYGDTTTTKDDHPLWHRFNHRGWLVRDLARARSQGAKWIFVGAHEMFFPVGGHLRDGIASLGMHFKYPPDSLRQANLDSMNVLWQTLVNNNVAAYLCGHEHLYAREEVDGVYQIIAGSSGAPVYSFNPTFDQKVEKKVGQEFSYEEALPYLKARGYNYGPGKNSQKADNFVGVRAYHYVLLHVTPDSVLVKMYGMKIHNDSMTKADSTIVLLDSFTIKKGEKR